MLQMRLEEEPLDLAAFGLLLGFDLVERKLEGAGGCQPGLQQRELNPRRSRINQKNKLLSSCSYGNITVRTMSRISVPKSGIRPVERNASLQRHTQRFLELRRGLEQIEYFCKGTVLKRMMKCGKAQCACASDATKRHGPYFELTYKANGKTVNVKLSPQAAPLYRAAAQQYRKLKILLNRLDKLSKTILRHQAKLAESKRQN